MAKTMPALASRRQYQEQMKIIRLMMMPLTYGVFWPYVKIQAAMGRGGSFARRFGRGGRRLIATKQNFGDYQPTAHDVIAAVYFKSGTNWLLQMTHQIAHRGAGEFEHIHDVVPWPDGMTGYALPLADDRPAAMAPTGLRVIKTHLALDEIPFNEAAKYICVVRDPKDVAASGYYFLRDTAFGPLMPDVDGYLDFFLSDEFLHGSWAQHLSSFWAARDRPNVLFMTYREMRADLAGTVARVADFMGVRLTDADMAAVVERSSFGYMQGLNEKFYSGLVSPWGVADGTMIRKGQVGASHELLSPAQQAHIDAHCRAELTRLGCDFSYDAHFGAA